MSGASTIKNSFWADEKRHQRFLELYARGWSHTQIAAELGCTKNASVGRAHVLGLPARCKTPNRNYKQKVTVMKAGKPAPASKHKPEPEPKPLPPHPLATPPPPPAFAEPAPEGVTIFELTYLSCRWPLSENPDVHMRYCGKHKREPAEGNAYCEEHHGRSIAAVQRRITNIGSIKALPF